MGGNVTKDDKEPAEDKTRRQAARGNKHIAFRLGSDTSNSSRNSNDLPLALTILGYQLHKRIGEGGFSKVYIATNNRLPGIELACKVFKLNEIGHKWKECFLKKEMKLMTKVRHKNICSAYDVFKMRTRAYIFMKYAKNGTLEAWIQAHGGRVKEEQAKRWLHGLMSAVDYLHQHNIAHRDLKLENFLLDENLEPLITDFGFAVLNPNEDETTILRSTLCGTTLYLAPEVRTATSKKKYDAKSADIYSMGICLYEMLHSFKPFEGDYEIDSKELIRRQMICDFKVSDHLGLSHDCINLILWMLNARANKRPTAMMVLHHGWFRSLH